MTAMKNSELTPSLEDYLEAILHLVRKARVARVRDIAQRLGVGMSSVSTALKALAQRELVNYDPYQVITLTDRGREVAEEISQRHTVLRRFFVEVLGLDAEMAEANACRMEHAADDALLRRLSRFAEFVRSCPRAGQAWVEKFQTSCREVIDDSQCDACLRGACEKLRPGESPGAN